MIRTWITDVRPLYEDEKYRPYYEALPDFRKEKADRIRFQADKALSVGAWSLLQMVRKTYDISETAVFNLSHSGEYVLCSIYSGVGKGIQVGCDIEAIKNSRLKIAKRFFCDSEYEMICREEDPEKQKELFCRFWVLKESFMKATREGMALAMNSFEIELSNPPVLLNKPDRFPDQYRYREYEISNVPYKIAVCTNDNEIDSKLWMELKL